MSDGCAELHPVLGVVGGQFQDAAGPAEQLGGRRQRPERTQAGRRLGPTEADGRRAVEVEPRQAPGDVHGGLGSGTPRCGQVDQEDAVGHDHDRHVRDGGALDRTQPPGEGHLRPVAVAGHRGVPARPGHGRGDGAVDERGDQTGVRVAVGEYVEREQLGGVRHRCGVTADLLEQHGRLHPAEPEAAAGLGDGHPRPALLGHGGPEPRVEGGRVRQVGPHLRGSRMTVEEPPGLPLEGGLVDREIEVHSWIV